MRYLLFFSKRVTNSLGHGNKQRKMVLCIITARVSFVLQHPAFRLPSLLNLLLLKSELGLVLGSA